MDSMLDMLELASGNVALYGLSLILSLTFVIFVHELGHYCAARFFGVRITKFALGFGKELTGFTDRKGTRWVLNCIPLGGYIAIFGDLNPEKPQIYDEVLQAKRPLNAEELRVAFFTKPLWQRALIVAAGPAINFILALLILTLLFNVRGEISTPPTITAIAKNTVGYEAGFKLGDRFVAIDGDEVERFEDVWEKSYNHPGQSYVFEIQRGEEHLKITARPEAIEYLDDDGIRRAHGRLGAVHFSRIKFKDIYGVNGVFVKGQEAYARRLIEDRMGQDVEVDLRLVGEESEPFILHLYPESNSHLQEQGHEDFDSFFITPARERFFYKHEWPAALYYAGKQSYTMLDEAFRMLGAILGGTSKKQVLGGVSSMGNAAGKAAKDGVYTFFVFIAVLSIQIGFINLLPIPVLDGGYLAFFAYEAVAGKPLSEKAQAQALWVGLAFLFGIMIIANVSDIFLLTRP